MPIVQVKTNVLLPNWLQSRRSTMNDKEFRLEVINYLKRYSNYDLDRISEHGEFAVCTRTDEVSSKKVKKRRKEQS